MRRIRNHCPRRFRFFAEQRAVFDLQVLVPLSHFYGFKLLPAIRGDKGAKLFHG